MRKQQSQKNGARTSGLPAPRSLVFTASASSAERAAKRAQCVEELVRAADPVQALNHIRPITLLQQSSCAPTSHTLPMSQPPVVANNASTPDTAFARSNRPRVPLFVPPRKQAVEENPSNFPPPSVVIATHSSTLLKPRRFVVTRENFAGVHCFVWGEAFEEDDLGLIVILVQKSKEDFDFCQFLDSVSLVHAKFILLDQFSWGSALVETLQVLIRAVSGKITPNASMVICAGGKACFPCLEALSVLKLRENRSKAILAAAFVYPAREHHPEQQQQLPDRLSGLANLSIYLEAEIMNDALEMVMKASGAQVLTCGHFENLHEFLRSRKQRASEPLLTQYSPSAQECTQNEHRLEEDGIVMSQCTSLPLMQASAPTMLVLVCDVQNNYGSHPFVQLHTQVKQMVRVWGAFQRALDRPSMRLVEWTHPSLVLKRGDVLNVPFVPGLTIGHGIEEEEDDWRAVKLDLSQAKSVRSDDPIRASFVRLAFKAHALPNSASTAAVATASTEDPFLPLARLISGACLEEGRRDLRVKILQVNAWKHELLVCDSSLPEGTYCKIYLQMQNGRSTSTSSLHRAHDFVVNSVVELRNVRIELSTRETETRFRACMDNKSGHVNVHSTEAPPPHVSPSSKLKFVSLELFARQKVVPGEYRLRGARIRDVLFQGFSWVRAMRHWQNRFRWTDCIVERQGDHWIFRECIALLTDVEDIDEDADFGVLVRRENINEILPFIRPQLLGGESLDTRHQQLLLLKQVLDAVTYPKNKPCEFAVRVNRVDAQPELLTMDI